MFGGKFIFSGGMCNYIGEDGTLQRNPLRDALNRKVRAHKNTVFDPQIDEISHGRAYNYAVDGPAEQKAREDSDVLLYQIGSETMGGVTMLEIIRDVTLGRKVILWLTGDKNDKGKPVFNPLGFKPDTITDVATKAHALQMHKQANSMRINLLDFINGAKNVRVAETEDAALGCLRQFGVRI